MDNWSNHLQAKVKIRQDNNKQKIRQDKTRLDNWSNHLQAKVKRIEDDNAQLSHSLQNKFTFPFFMISHFSLLSLIELSFHFLNQNIKTFDIASSQSSQLAFHNWILADIAPNYDV